MRAMLLTPEGALEPVEQPVAPPVGTQVLVRITAASLNYRDLLLMDARRKRPGGTARVPLSCGCGVVAAVGPGVTRFAVGDRVAPAFFQDWIDGPPEQARLDTALGGDVDGVAREHGLFDQQGLVAVPDMLGDLEAAALPCAAVTAWNALFVARATRPGDVVLLQGTGGVSIVGLQLAKAAGATVIITSSSDAKLQRARSLGADHLINYRTTPHWGERARAITGGRGVDVVLEVGGAQTLAQSVAAVAEHGTIAGIGLLAGTPVWSVPQPPTQLQRIRVGSREHFEQLNRAIAATGLRPVIDRVYPLAHLGQALDTLRSGTVFGKVAIQMHP